MLGLATKITRIVAC